MLATELIKKSVDTNLKKKKESEEESEEESDDNYSNRKY